MEEELISQVKVGRKRRGWGFVPLILLAGRKLDTHCKIKIGEIVNVHKTPGQIIIRKREKEG